MNLSYEVEIKRLAGNEDIELPQKMSLQASGFDLYAAITDEVVLESGTAHLDSDWLCPSHAGWPGSPNPTAQRTSVQAWHYLPQ